MDGRDSDEGSRAGLPSALFGCTKLMRPEVYDFCDSECLNWGDRLGCMYTGSLQQPVLGILELGTEPALIHLIVLIMHSTNDGSVVQVGCRTASRRYSASIGSDCRTL